MDWGNIDLGDSVDWGNINSYEFQDGLCGGDEEALVDCSFNCLTSLSIRMLFGGGISSSVLFPALHVLYSDLSCHGSHIRIDIFFLCGNSLAQVHPRIDIIWTMNQNQIFLSWRYWKLKSSTFISHAGNMRRRSFSSFY